MIYTRNVFSHFNKAQIQICLGSTRSRYGWGCIWWGLTYQHIDGLCLTMSSCDLSSIHSESTLWSLLCYKPYQIRVLSSWFHWILIDFSKSLSPNKITCDQTGTYPSGEWKHIQSTANIKWEMAGDTYSNTWCALIDLCKDQFRIIGKRKELSECKWTQ